MVQSISTYQNLKQINAEIFHEIKFTGNIFLVDKDYSEDKEYDSVATLEITKAWYELYDEYFERTDNPSFKKDLRNKDKSLGLLLKIKLIEDVVNLLKHLDEHKEYVPNEVYLETIANLGNNLKRADKYIKFDSTKPIKPQIIQIESVLGGLKTRYQLLFKEDLQVNESDISLYYDIKAEIEMALDRNLPQVINMLQWISYEKQYKRKIKSLQKHK